MLLFDAEWQRLRGSREIQPMAVRLDLTPLMTLLGRFFWVPAGASLQADHGGQLGADGSGVGLEGAVEGGGSDGEGVGSG
ncbi:hypothetical protein SsS58_07542 [Streptomyces scabiei]|uniref:Uncharacterized protein n=1 Tax=Streptomyces scabiei TaxID=1930 RepID=A0A100JWR0_STRSC|nr:hypothetical protein SsS58_07542 [Streptomyces scabiei]